MRKIRNEFRTTAYFSLFPFILLISLLQLSWLVSSVSLQNVARPHIVFLIADDLGYGDVGYHGSDIQTPNMDSLAAAGIALENYYVQPICTPSRNCFLTGRYPIRTGLQHGVIAPKVPAGLPLDERTLANALQDAGYATHIVGKWHLGFYKKEFTPLHRGFQSHYGYYLGEQNYFNHTRDQGYDWRHEWKTQWDDKGLYSTHLLTDRVEKIVSDHNPEQPLFLYLAYQAVHNPWLAPDKYIKPYDHIKNVTRRTYAAVVSCLDEAIGNVTNIFKKYGMWNDTILIVTSDNGGVVPIQSNYPLRGGKNSLFEGGVRVPGFVYSVDIELMGKGGQINRELIHAVDWYPSIIRLAGGSLDQPLPIDGVDVWPTIINGEPSPRKEILIDMDPLRPMAAIRVGDWKLITGKPCIEQHKNANCRWYSPPQASSEEAKEDISTKEQDENSVWLFNITADPTERYNVYKQYPLVVEALRGRLEYYATQMVPPQTDKEDPAADPSLHGGVWRPWMDSK